MNEFRPHPIEGMDMGRLPAMIRTMHRNARETAALLLLVADRLAEPGSETAVGIRQYARTILDCQDPGKLSWFIRAGNDFLADAAIVVTDAIAVGKWTCGLCGADLGTGTVSPADHECPDPRKHR